LSEGEGRRRQPLRWEKKGVEVNPLSIALMRGERKRPEGKSKVKSSIFFKYSLSKEGGEEEKTRRI